MFLLSNAVCKHKYVQCTSLQCTATSPSVAAAAGKMAGAREKAAEERHSFKQPAMLTGGQLKPYQLDGVQWLASLFSQGLSGILADEMGLGKTIQANAVVNGATTTNRSSSRRTQYALNTPVIGLLAYLYEKEVKGPYIICAPLATLPNWINEIKKWCPRLKCVLYHGPKADRDELRETVMHPSKQKDRNFPIVVTSFETCINDRAHLQRYTWRYMILDEGQRVKNKRFISGGSSLASFSNGGLEVADCRLVRELKLLPTESRILLSGTPIQNTLELVLGSARAHTAHPNSFIIANTRHQHTKAIQPYECVSEIISACCRCMPLWYALLTKSNVFIVACGVLQELWSLLNFVNPSIFDDLTVFRSWFGFKNIGRDTSVEQIVSEEEQAAVVTKLHEILRPFLLRRLKRDVLQ
eukprot:20321-Heterococcus_DN1.PRE.1